jgi:hypothetical protein
MKIVRRAIQRYVSLVRIVRKFSSVQVRSMPPVNASTVQNAEMKSAASAAR